MCAEQARNSPVVKARMARWMKAFLSNCIVRWEKAEVAREEGTDECADLVLLP